MKRTFKIETTYFLAVVLSALIHLAILFGMYLSLSGSSISGIDAAAEGEFAMEVSLSGWEGAPQTESASKSATHNNALLKLASRLENAETPLYAGDPSRQPPSSLDQLLDEQAASSGLGSKGQGQFARGESQDGGDNDITSKSKEGASSNISGNGLWDQIEPCWRRLPQKSGVGVTLEVTLDNQGRLMGPPQILRPASASPDEARLVAETEALNAIQACLPFKAPNAFGLKKTYRINFR